MSRAGFGEAKCRWCKKPIKWADTETRRKMPLDRDPNPAGNVQLVNGVATILAGLLLDEARESNTVLHMPHFATCPSPFNPANRKKKR